MTEQLFELNHFKIAVYFEISDFALNWADTSYSFTTRGAKLIVQPNPSTPNGDGFNDRVEFNFEQFEVDQPDLKVFDIHGKKIIQLDAPIGQSFWWDGRDNTGRLVLPGAYLYIFSDRSKAIARGCVVIAR